MTDFDQTLAKHIDDSFTPSAIRAVDPTKITTDQWKLNIFSLLNKAPTPDFWKELAKLNAGVWSEISDVANDVNVQLSKTTPVTIGASTGEKDFELAWTGEIVVWWDDDSWMTLVDTKSSEKVWAEADRAGKLVEVVAYGAVK